MSYTTATVPQRVTLQGALIQAEKPVTVDVSGGQSIDLSGIDTQLGAVASALNAIGINGAAATQKVISNGDTVNIPTTFTTARAAGQVATVNIKFTVANGAITAAVVP